MQCCHSAVSSTRFECFNLLRYLLLIPLSPSAGGIQLHFKDRVDLTCSRSRVPIGEDLAVDFFILRASAGFQI